MILLAFALGVIAGVLWCIAGLVAALVIGGGVKIADARAASRPGVSDLAGPDAAAARLDVKL